jgi:hypothetical protein
VVNVLAGLGVDLVTLNPRGSGPHVGTVRDGDDPTFDRQLAVVEVEDRVDFEDHVLESLLSHHVTPWQ